MEKQFKSTYQKWPSSQLYVDFSICVTCLYQVLVKPLFNITQHVAIHSISCSTNDITSTMHHWLDLYT